jgi:hypothetical protein
MSRLFLSRDLEGRNGCADTAEAAVPRWVAALVGQRMVSVSCGLESTMSLTVDGAVPPPSHCHHYPDRNLGLTEIYLRFERPVRIVNLTCVTEQVFVSGFIPAASCKAFAEMDGPSSAASSAPPRTLRGQWSAADVQKLLTPSRRLKDL